MRVLHVMASMAPEWGGTVTMVSGLTSALAQIGIPCEIATTTGWRVGTDMNPVPGVPIHRFATQFPSRVWTSYSRGLRRFLDDEIGRFDLVQIHELWHYGGFAAFHAVRRRNIPFVQVLHGELDQWRLRHKGIRKWLYRKLKQDHILSSADAIYALTRAEQQRVRELGYQTPVFIAPNGINLDELEPPANPEQSAPGAPGLLERYPELQDKRVVLFLGRLHVMKGLDVLARSFAAIAGRFPDAVLLAAGPDEDGTRGRMEAILREAGVLDRAVFTGLLTGDDKRAVLKRADLFVLSSYSEGFSAAVVEALGHGLPVVITEQCNFPEVAENDAGFVVPPSDADVAEAMSALLADSALCARMGQNGRKLIAEHYTWQAIAESVAGLYQAILEDRPVPG